MKKGSNNRDNVTTEKQFLKMMKNITEEPLRKSKEDWQKDEYEFVFKNGFSNAVEYSPKNYLLFDGLKPGGFCICGSRLQFKHCCEKRAGLLVDSLLHANYAEAVETTKDITKLPIGFHLSPIFQLNLSLELKDAHLIKEAIRTHPTIVDHLYLISARELAMESAKSPYARYHYDLMVSFEEDTPFDFKKKIDGDKPLNDTEIERYVYGKTTVPSGRHHMRENSVHILSENTFVLK